MIQISVAEISELFKGEFHPILDKFRTEHFAYKNAFPDPVLYSYSSCCIIHDGFKPLVVLKGLHEAFKLKNNFKEGSIGHEISERILNNKQVDLFMIYTQKDSDAHWIDAVVSFMQKQLQKMEGDE